MEFTYNNFNIIIELSIDDDILKFKIYDDNTNKLYQDIFDNKKLNYKPIQIYRLLIDFFSEKNDIIDINICIENNLIDTLNTLIITIGYKNDYYEINQILRINEVENESVFFEIEKINKKVEKFKSSLNNQIINILNDIGLAIPISDKDYIPLNTTILGIDCFEFKHKNINNFNMDDVDNIMDNEKYNGYFEKTYSNKIIDFINKIDYTKINITYNYDNITDYYFYVNSSKEILYKNKSGTDISAYNIYLATIHNKKYKNKEIIRIHNFTGGFKCTDKNHNTNYFMHSIKYCLNLTYLYINCVYIEQFEPKYLPESIEYLYIVDIDQEILNGLDHLVNLNRLYLKFIMNKRLLINASKQIKKLLKNNPELEIIIDNYNEIKSLDLELITLVKFR